MVRHNLTKLQTALVTGSSRGIGKGIALAMAAEGYNLAIHHWNDHDNAREVCEYVRQTFDVRCDVFECNLEHQQSPETLADEVVRRMGKIHVLVNNAGVTKFGDVTNMPIDQINTLMNLDFRAPVLLMGAVGRQMIENRIKGSMINITSSRAERAYPGDAVYGGVKAALRRAVQSIALDFSAYGIRVNCIAPGAIQTTDERKEYYEALGKQIPLNRAGTPEDIGNAAVWLASEKASYLTGITIRVDGGLILPGMPETANEHADISWRRYK